ncbi:alpha/beta fold hydrolase [Rhodococcoides fascians]
MVTDGPYTVAALADDILAVMDLLERGRVHLVGLSLAVRSRNR